MTTQSGQSESRRAARAQIHFATPRVNTFSAALLLAIALLLFCAPLARAQVFLDLHDFAVYSGSSPTSPWLMAEGRDNNLYGVTATGGTHKKGTIFKIGPSGGFAVIHNFDGTHGATPVGGLTLGLDGNLYGMAEREGKHGFGNIFRITPAGVFTVLYSFLGGTDGGLPVSPLIIGADGNFYGTSYKSGGGTAFRMTPAGVLTVISEIPTTSYGPLLQAKDGTLYGVTEFAGKKSAGSVYRIIGAKYTILHSFDGPTGSYPVGGLVEGADGNFYGTTTAGGSTNAGVIYRITPSGTYHVMFEWSNKQTLNGYQAFAGLIAGADGKLYGATIWGGQSGYGVIFSMTTAGGYSVLYNFDVPHGDGAYATPIQHTNGEIYGITTRGGGALDGVIYGFNDNLTPFVKLVKNAGVVGEAVGILGHGFAQATSVEFNGKPASFHVISDTFMTTTIPSGQTGFVTVDTSSGPFKSNRIFRVEPALTTFSPLQGRVGTTVTLNGQGLIQTSAINVGSHAASTFTVTSDSKVKFKIPAGAKTARIVLNTPGGKATTTASFKVLP